MITYIYRYISNGVNNLPNISTVVSFSFFLSCEVNMRSKMQSVASLTCVGERKGTPSELFVKVVNNATFDCYDDQYSSAKPF